MIKRLVLLFTLFGAFILAPVCAGGTIYATTDEDLQAACAAAEQNGTKTPSYCANLSYDKNPISGNDGIIIKVANVVAFAAGAVAVFMVVYGGFRYIISNGDPAKITSARQVITYALIGLVVTVLARSIIVFVINRLS